MTNQIKIKRSETADDVPTNAQLVEGEIAVNLTEGRIYSETSGNVVVQIGNAVKYVQFVLVASTVDNSVQTTIGGDFRVPFTGTIKEVGAYVDTAGTTGLQTIDIHLNGTTIMTTNKITIDTGEKSSETAATAPALTTTAYTKDDILTFDVDGIHTTAAKGLKVWMTILETA